MPGRHVIPNPEGSYYFFQAGSLAQQQLHGATLEQQ